MVDLTWMKVDAANWKICLRGIDTYPSQVIIEKNTRIFTIGLKLLAVEYVLGGSIKDILNRGKMLSGNFWQIEESGMDSLKKFCQKASQKIQAFSAKKVDQRKKKLFDLIYTSHGAIQVKELSEQAFWSSRQINRYFNEQFGISPKKYCNIVRLGSSFKHISEGRLFPEQNFTDQNHFIKEIKKYAGVTPKELSKNKDDSFIDITAIKNLPA